MLKKAYILILTFIFTLSPIICRPFHISGESSLFTEPFSGYNINIIDYAIDSDRVYTLSSNSSSGTFQTTSGSAISMGEGTMSNGKTYYSTGLAGGGVSLQGNITLSMSNSLSSSVTNQIRRVIEIEIILNNSYCGNASVTLKNGSTTLKEEIVQFNGTSSRFTYVDSSLNMTNADNYTIQIGTFYLVDSVNKQWQFPFESFSFAYPMLSNLSEYQIGIDTYNEYLLPIFEIPVNTEFIRYNVNASQTLHLIMFVDKNIYTSALFSSYFNINSNNGATITHSLVEYYSDTDFMSTESYRDRGKFIHMTFNTDKNTQIYLSPKRVTTIMPIYSQVVFDNSFDGTFNVSTEFGLVFKLNNKLLNNLDIIANGNTSSNNSSSALNDSNDDLSNAIGSYDSLENTANDNMNSALNSIDMTNTPDAMGSKFQASAIWVKQQFDRMTNNTPFGSLLGFSLILGISLLIIGRVLK